eukprot:COSAG02_NODE_2203_length_9520_cov_14.356013_12_plen_57_part_00
MKVHTQYDESIYEMRAQLRFFCDWLLTLRAAPCAANFAGILISVASSKNAPVPICA